MRTLVAMAAIAAAASCEPVGNQRTALPTLRLEPVSRYGSQGAAGSALTSVVGVAPTDSEVLVLESSPARVAVFNRQGEWLRDVGREGEGPGEFRRPELIGVSDGEIWVGDPSGGRLEVFSHAGESVRSLRWQLAPDSLGTRTVPMALFSDGSVLGGPASLAIGSVTRGATTHRNYFRADRDGSTFTLLYREDINVDDFMTAEVSEDLFVVGAHPLRYSPLVSPFPGGSGLAIVERPAARAGTPARFRLVAMSADGALDLDTDVAYEPVPAPDWLEAHLADMEREMLSRSGSVDRSFLRALREGLAPRDFYPAVTDLVAGADGTIWVARGGPATDSTAWEIFDPDGVRIGTLIARRDLTILHASLEDVWATLPDEYDVPFVWHMNVVR